MSCLIQRVLQIQTPVPAGTVIKLYCTPENEITSTCLFSWSTDSICWVNYVDFNTYKTLIQNIDSDYYLRILFTGDICMLTINGEPSTCYNITLYTENPFLQSFCDNANLFNPYLNLDCALQLQQQMSDSIICMLGIPCYYFKVTPDVDTVDYTFKEYVLHNVESVKVIKLMLQDGQLPSSNPQMTEFDFEWDNDWEVEVGKTQFAQAFGDTAFPKQRDFLYVPMMKRMYEVNAAYDEKQDGLMWRAVTWKLGLIKWNDKTNVGQNEFEDFIDNLTVNTYAEVFGKEHEEQRRLSGADQAESPKFAANNLYELWYEDAIRSGISIDDKKSVITTQINNRSVRLAVNMYDFKKQDSIITYQQGYCCESGALSFIISTVNKKLPIEVEKTLIQIGDIEVKYVSKSLRVKDLEVPIEENSTYLVGIHWNRDNFTIEMELYKLSIDQEIPVWMRKPEMFEFKLEKEVTSSYDDRFNIKEKAQVTCSPWPLMLTNIKLFDCKMDKENLFLESNKYTTTNPHCVLNDLARPVDAGLGFNVR